MIEWLPWLPSKSCYTNLKFFETLKDTPNTSEGFRFAAFLVLEIPGWVLFDSPPPWCLVWVPKPLVPEGLKMPRARIALQLMSTHLQLMGLSSESILLPIQQASDFSRLSLSEEYNWNVAQGWNIVSSELTSDVSKSASSAYADSLISLSPILIHFTSSFSRIE